jgi:hypothetical protein
MGMGLRYASKRHIPRRFDADRHGFGSIRAIGFHNSYEILQRPHCGDFSASTGQKSQRVGFKFCFSTTQPEPLGAALENSVPLRFQAPLPIPVLAITGLH